MQRVLPPAPTDGAAPRLPAVAASLSLHAAFALLLVLAIPAGSLPDFDEGIAIELILTEDLAASLDPPATDLTPATPREPRRPATTPAPPAMIRAARILSGEALADPRSRQAREALSEIDATERMVQLCNLEALEQVNALRPELKPERVIAYAAAELRITGDAVEADGAALAGNGGWYHLRFRCRLAGDAVAAFEFALGAAVPRSTWAALNLPPPNDMPEESDLPDLAGSADAAHIGRPINN